MTRSVSAPGWRLPAALCLALLVSPAIAQPLTDAPIAVTRGDAAELRAWNRPILTLRARIGESSPAERAARAADRIAAIPDEELEQPVRVVPARVGNLEGLM